MSQKNYLTLDDEFIRYCELNKITDTEKFAKKVFGTGFNITKYGESPPGFNSRERIIEKEIIKEVPVETIVEKVENQKLKDELNTITKSLEGLGKKGKLMKDSNLSSLYDE